MSEHGEMLPECIERWKQGDKDHAAIKEDLAAIRQAVVGNGNPKNSLTSRVMALETWLKLGVVIVAIATIAGVVVAAWKS